MKRVNKIILVTGVVLVIYGYLCREINLYLFWDSKSIGWFVLAFGSLFYLFELNKSRRNQGRKRFWIKAGIFVIILGLILSGYLIYDFINSRPYQVGIEYAKHSSQLQEEIGKISGFGLVPTGSMETVSVNGSQTEKAIFFITAKGDRKFKDVKITLVKSDTDSDWLVKSLY